MNLDGARDAKRACFLVSGAMPLKLVPGLYETLVSDGLGEALAGAADGLEAERDPLHAEAAPHLLARHVHDLVLKALHSTGGDDALLQQVHLVNALIDTIGRHSTDSGVDNSDRVPSVAEVLLSLRKAGEARLGQGNQVRPTLPLRHSDLLVNGPHDLRLGHELRRELASADGVDLIVSFVKWTGLRLIRKELEDFARRRPGRLRVITTTYMGASEARAIEELLKLGAEVKVSYDERRTRLHAKAWLFHRESGFSTAMVGSSNLSQAAMLEGCEWNVRLSTIDNGNVLKKFAATFEQYWNDPAFEPFELERFTDATQRRDPQRDALARAVQLRPLPHQEQVLDALARERSHGHTRNLVVAATGTGKTVVAALDYARLRRERGELSLLFVAHREEILSQSLATFRAATRDGYFGEMLVGKHKPIDGRHVFASIQSLHEGRLRDLRADAYDIVIVDEFHHAAAKSYTALLAHLKPQILLGLTATPERTDGKSVLGYFDGRIAAELRLWDALDQNLVVPFQYFGIHDGTDLSTVAFRSGRYDVDTLEQIYTADHVRARAVLTAVIDKIVDPHRMRAIGFCVSVKHAQFMAAFFNEKGLPALAIHGDTADEERRAALQKLRAGEVNVVFAVDLLNEGVDVPAVDTVLFLRPTESATIFLQQLGRGLRLEEGKSCLTVLDFIGSAHRQFRFVDRFRALVPGPRAVVRRAVEEGFPHLPAGCDIHLEPQARAAVLQNIRHALSNSWRALADDLRALGDVSLPAFLNHADVELEEVYGRPGRSFTALRHDAGLRLGPAPDDEIIRAVPRLLHIDDDERLDRYRRWLGQPVVPEFNLQDPFALMFFAALGLRDHPVSSMQAQLGRLWQQPDLRQELRELLDVVADRQRHRTWATTSVAGPPMELPFQVHARYGRDEISAGLRQVRGEKLLRTQGGVLHCADAGVDVLYVEVNKDPKHYTPTTLYNDYALSPTRFHWESQSVTRADSPTGQRYRGLGTPPWWRILLFVRQEKNDSRGFTSPYTFLGPVRCVSHQGERPMQIVWELERPMPPSFYSAIKIAAG
jgi:superfamily II DNA or RNA helicase